MNDAAAAVLYANDVVLGQAIDEVKAEQGARIRTLEAQLKQLQNLINNMRRQNATISATLTTGVHGEFTTAAAARAIQAGAASRPTTSRLQDPGCANCSTS